MPDFLYNIKLEISQIFHNKFTISVPISEINLVACKKEFEGEFTLVTFPWSKSLGHSPDKIANIIGEALLLSNKIKSFNVVKGFLNLSMSDVFWRSQMTFLKETSIEEQIRTSEPEKYIIEYCSPNTNKPLHLGHIRNILVGWSVYKIIKAIGHTANTTQVINDRGIAICKSMLTWELFSNGSDPASSKIKGDHFVGDYYVLFENKFKEEYKNWQSTDLGIKTYQLNKKSEETEETFFIRYKNEYFNNFSELGIAAKKMLLAWESGDQETVDLWKKMNSWVYDGFNETFKKLQVSFDSQYFESNTYLLGKDIIEKGLRDKVFIKDPDNSIWIDLTDVGLDRKIVLRSDGTSVYITQDLGTADERHQHHHAHHYIYVVGDEQDYHFKVLKETLKKLGMPYAEGIQHLSYGMVELPTGKMKSREGTVVDADDLIDEVIKEAELSATERGELDELTTDAKTEVIRKIGMAALKYFMLKIQAKKRMIFNPAESVDMQGHTGPYIANAYVRIQSILRRRAHPSELIFPNKIEASEKFLIQSLLEYKQIMQEAASQLDPAHLANYIYQLAKDFHKYYHDYRILNAESEETILWRLTLCNIVGKFLEHGMSCLGIEMPDRM